jgi:hypothetical protein
MALVGLSDCHWVVMLWPISCYLTRKEEMLFLLRVSTQLELTDFNQEMRLASSPTGGGCKMTGYEASNLELPFAKQKMITFE